MNTRRYPRTLNEAFRRTATYGCAIELPARKRLADRLFSAAIVCAWILIAFVAFKSLQIALR